MSGPIEDYLQDLRGELRGDPLLYFPNPGNGGDSLIAVATYHVLDRKGVPFRVIERDAPDSVLRGAVVAIGGGGNLVRHYTMTRDFLARAHRLARKVVVLPHTIRAHPEVLGALGPNVDLIVREQPSLRYVSEHARSCNILVMDDLALSVDTERARRGRPPMRLPTAAETARLLRYKWRAGLPPRTADPRVLNCFRTDGESTDIALPPDNIDVSMRFWPGVRHEAATFIGVGEILRFLDRFEIINTNRLHMAVSGVLLGKTVRFHDNNYGKNRAVYEQSLKGRYGGLEWRGGGPEDDA